MLFAKLSVTYIILHDITVAYKEQKTMCKYKLFFHVGKYKKQFSNMLTHYTLKELT